MKYLHELATFASLAKLFLGGLIHKIGAFFYTKYKAAKAEASKLEDKAEAEVKKIL